MVSVALLRAGVNRLALAGLVAMGLAGLVAMAWRVSHLLMLEEAGYGDSYILYDVLHLQQTGQIYRDLSQPPYLAAQYSPLVYIVFALANQSLDLANPFIGPRLVVLCAFAICVGVTSSIARGISPLRLSWAFAILLVASTSTIWIFLLQSRADFLGIACSLASVRLLMSRRRSAVYAAALCAGLALQFKITLVAAAAAGTLWLLWRREWNMALKFCATAGAASVGLYLLYWLREPQMFSQILTLSPGVRDAGGAIALLLVAALEAVALLALPGIHRIASRSDPKGLLVLLYAAISFLVAALTSLQAGASINYYFETFFALVPVAVVGIQRLTLPSQVFGPLAIIAIVAVRLFLSVDFIYADRSRTESVASRNADFRQVETIIRSHRVFSTVPRLALIDPMPHLMEPYLLSYLLRMGRFDQTPILEPIRKREFEGVVTHARSQAWRGVPLVNPQLRAAIAQSYSPHCRWKEWLLHLPKGASRETNALARQMAAAGCRPDHDPRW